MLLLSVAGKGWRGDLHHISSSLWMLESSPKRLTHLRAHTPCSGSGAINHNFPCPPPPRGAAIAGAQEQEEDMMLEALGFAPKHRAVKELDDVDKKKLLERGGSTREGDVERVAGLGASTYA